MTNSNNDQEIGSEMMTPDEARRLREIQDEYHNSPWRHSALPAFFVGLIGVGAVIAPFAVGEMVAAVLFWSAAAGCFWFAWIGFKLDARHSRMVSNLELDMKSGRKENVEGSIQNKREARGRYSVGYYFRVLDGEYAVDLTTYTRFDAGDRVRLSLSKKARMIVGVRRVG